MGDNSPWETVEVDKANELPSDIEVQISTSEVDVGLPLTAWRRTPRLTGREFVDSSNDKLTEAEQIASQLECEKG
jgi:hypothetical protein